MCVCACVCVRVCVCACVCVCVCECEKERERERGTVAVVSMASWAASKRRRVDWSVAGTTATRAGATARAYGLSVEG